MHRSAEAFASIASTYLSSLAACAGPTSFLAARQHQVAGVVLHSPFLSGRAGTWGIGATARLPACLHNRSPSQQGRAWLRGVLKGWCLMALVPA